MNAIFLNIAFAVVAVLVAVGIPFVGLAWQRSERKFRAASAVESAPRPAAGYRGPNAPVPNSWATERELRNANDRTFA